MIAMLLCCLVPSATYAKQSVSKLDKLVAPIALYPDSLLGNVLVASTFSDDVIDADAWLAKNPGLTASQISDKTKSKTWDESVKTLLLVPDTLAMMVDDLEWTDQLGQAFVNQRKDLMESVQRLRKQAKKTGALTSNDKVTVTTNDENNIIIGSSNPEVIVVPDYDVNVVYGWDPLVTVEKTALVWGTTALLNSVFHSSCWDWNHYDVWVGPGYGNYYWHRDGYRPFHPGHPLPPDFHPGHHPDPYHPYYHPPMRHPEHHNYHSSQSHSAIDRAKNARYHNAAGHNISNRPAPKASSVKDNNSKHHGAAKTVQNKQRPGEHVNQARPQKANKRWDSSSTRKRNTVSTPSHQNRRDKNTSSKTNVRNSKKSTSSSRASTGYSHRSGGDRQQ